MIYFIAAGLAILLDQLSKLWIVHTMSLYQSKEIVSGLFNLVYVTNKGAAFSMFAQFDSPYRHYFFLIIGVVACVGLTYLNFKLISENRYYGLALGLIAGGAIGNLIDRVTRGAVVDFLDVYWKGYHWPAFNIADSCICVGVFLFFLLNLKSNKKTGKI